MTGRVPEGERRKNFPLATGLFDFFPDALLAVAEISRINNDRQIGEGQPLKWGRATNNADALLRHFMDRGEFDSDGVRHSAALAWRALALLQQELDDARMIATVSTPAKPEQSLEQSVAAAVLEESTPIPKFLTERA